MRIDWHLLHKIQGKQRTLYTTEHCIQKVEAISREVPNLPGDLAHGRLTVRDSKDRPKSNSLAGLKLEIM